jgi:hypothetical protein
MYLAENKKAKTTFLLTRKHILLLYVFKNKEPSPSQFRVLAYLRLGINLDSHNCGHSGFNSRNPGGYACSGTGDLICRALGAEGEDLVLSFQNKLPFDIIINPYTGIRFDGRAGYASIKYRGKTYRFEDATISKGDQFQVTGIGLGDASSISITYKETATGFAALPNDPANAPFSNVLNTLIAGIFAAIALTAKLFLR